MANTPLQKRIDSYPKGNQVRVRLEGYLTSPPTLPAGYKVVIPRSTTGPVALSFWNSYIVVPDQCTRASLCMESYGMVVDGIWLLPEGAYDNGGSPEEAIAHFLTNPGRLLTS